MGLSGGSSPPWDDQRGETMAKVPRSAIPGSSLGTETVRELGVDLQGGDQGDIVEILIVMQEFEGIFDGQGRDDAIDGFAHGDPLGPPFPVDVSGQEVGALARGNIPIIAEELSYFCVFGIGGDPLEDLGAHQPAEADIDPVFQGRFKALNRRVFFTAKQGNPNGGIDQDAMHG